LRRRHFEELQPVCPVCLHQRSPGEVHRLALASVERERDATIVEGMLHCSNRSCQREYPVIDGIPLLLADLRGFVAGNLPAIMARTDLAAVTESLLGDCCGPASEFDHSRRHLSSYVWDHYADLDSEEPPAEVAPGSVTRLLRQGLAMLGNWCGPTLDLGCSVGRTAFTLAGEQNGLVLGVDSHFASLRVASEVLRYGRLRYPRKRVGLAFDRREFAVDLPGSDLVDFWACDGLSLPLQAGTFGLATGLNLLDAVASPRDLLQAFRTMLRPGGKAFLAAPYDWSSSVTPMEAWLGGHSQRGPEQAAAEPVLRRLLAGGHPHGVDGFEFLAEIERLDWNMRLHDRARVAYAVHAIALQTTKS
jgi:SAM-dependent methyltransferase/uncharacterized protein YbaR (Trm112 family)